MESEDAFVADYHETEEAFLLVYNLGRLSLEWNMVEQFFTALIWEYLGDYKIGMAVTGGLGGNRSKADVLVELARQRTDQPELLDRVEFASKAFNILRENRNMLIHSHSIFPARGHKPSWRRATGRGPSGHISTHADFDDLERIIADIVRLGIFVVDLVTIVRPRRPDAVQHIPDKFKMPAKLKQAPFDPSERE